MTDRLADLARAVLATAGAPDKAEAARRLAARWRETPGMALGAAGAPDRPARPGRPCLMPPRDMPKRRAEGGPAARIALLHALAHIELNAVDLASDMVARFAPTVLDPSFAADWVRVADEEATHFLLLADRLAALGAAYGDLPAHDGLWQAAFETRHDLLARLAIVPLVLEARGLDVTPGLIAKLRRAGDTASADALAIVYRDEIGHVAIGRRWFEREAAARGLAPVAAWRALVARHFKGGLKPPFNDDARAAAGFARDYYAADAAGAATLRISPPTA